MPRNETDGGTGVSTLVEHATASLATVSRYDFVLAVVPLAFLVAVAVGTLLSIPARDAVLVASGVAVVALLDALFLNPPGNATRA